MRDSEIRCLVDGAGEVTEDLAGRTDNACWVIDGATGLGERTFSDAESDGRWYVSRIDERLRERVGDRRRSIGEVLRESVAEVREAFSSYVDLAEVEAVEEPSAAIAVVRWGAGGLEYYVLGDCSVAVWSRQMDFRYVSGGGPRRLDRRVVGEVERLVCQEGHDLASARSEVISMLRAHRAQKNRPGGYWTLGFSREAIGHGLAGEIDGDCADRVLLFTDGFEDLVETFGIYRSWRSVARALDAGTPLEEMIRRLRSEQSGDPDGREFPRLKPADDAAACHVNFGGAEPEVGG